MDRLKRLPEETEEQFIWRIGQLKDSGQIDIDWNELTDIINRECREDESEYRNESAYRKPYQAAKRYFESGVFEKYSDDSYLKELSNAKHDLQKEKQKMFDERTELNRKIREQARRESFIESMKRIIEQTKPIEFNFAHRENRFSNNDLLCHLTDIHAGMKISNWFNQFDSNIMKDRLENYLSQMFEIAKKHNSENCYLVIGEVLSGIIHEHIRIENNENVIQQFITVSGLISNMIAEISKHFNDVYVYTTPGNHSRVIANKDLSLRGENFDVLIPHYLKASLQNYKNVHIEDNYEDCDVAKFMIRGNHVFSAHGDKDTPENVVQHFTMMFGQKPDIVLLGHMHRNALLTVYDTKVIQSGCVSGSDNYCIDKRLRNKPEQTISVVDENGLVCLYDIKLD